MRPLPRLLAVTDDRICSAGDFPIRAAAILSGGSSIGMIVRAPGANAAAQLRHLDRIRALARPTEAATIAHGDPALGKIGDAQGVQLRRTDLDPASARAVFGPGWIGVSVHSVEEADQAIAAGADYLVAGNVFLTASHPERPAKGIEWLREIASRGTPVFAIGGVTPDAVASIKATGAWGFAAIRAFWNTADPAKATTELLTAWDVG